MVKIYYCDIWKDVVFEINDCSYIRYCDVWVKRIGGMGFKCGSDGYGIQSEEYDKLELAYKIYMRQKKLERLCH